MIADSLGSLVAGVAGCNCRVCELHDQAHEQVPRHILGRAVKVDVELAPLLDALADAGVLTVGSCIDFADAVRQLWPEMLPRIRPGADTTPGVDYATVVARRWAFVQVIATAAAEPFLDTVEAFGGHVVRGGLVAQAAFPPALIGGLVRSL